METKRRNRNSEILLMYAILGVVFISMLFYKRITGISWLHDPSKQLLASNQAILNFNFSGANLFYSGHAKWRMECRQIKEKDVEWILKKGSINYQKSELKAPDCKRKYAFDGYTLEKKHLRIIATPCGFDKLTILTCIDLDKKWECDTLHQSENKNWPYLSY